jgi:2-polyprenyl-6-methoxyphenol hydroxylase-like FAD-dependent oxidoreductase
MTADADALVIGAGPAGAAAAIFLAQAGWHVVLVEQSVYPRQKVCGECLTAGGLAVLDELGVGAQVREHAGPELRDIGWTHGSCARRGRPVRTVPLRTAGRSAATGWTRCWASARRRWASPGYSRPR